MQRGYGHDYSFVVDSSFQPFSMQELLTPMLMYKEAFDKDEAAYTELSNNANKFKYLSDTLPEGSKARKIYEGYANDLERQANDFLKNGLNRRELLDLKRRYSGEIGRLVEADTALKKEQELRRQMNAKDPSMLWAEDNFNIDNYLDNKTPNLYGISGTDLYTRGAAVGKAASSRVYSSGDAGKTLGGYYRDYVEKMGYTPEQLAQFGDQIAADFSARVSALPELQQAANQILEANGVNKNLKGNSLRQAQQQVIRGIIDGAVYQESHKPVRDPGVLDASQIVSLQTSGWQNDGNGNWNYDIKRDPKHATDLWMYAIDPLTGTVTGPSQTYIDSASSGSVPGSKGRNGNKKPTNISSVPMVVGWRNNQMKVRAAEDGDKGTLDEVEYKDLPDHVKRMVKSTVGGDAQIPYYRYFYGHSSMFDSPDSYDEKVYIEPYEYTMDVNNASANTSSETDVSNDESFNNELIGN